MPTTFQLKHKLIRAGAGTGKTSCLINEVYDLFKNFSQAEGRPPRLIVCTFTKKSTAELKERLFKIAKEDLLQAQQDKAKFPSDGGSGSKDFNLFLNYIQSPGIYISTIDGILNMFLKRYGARFGLNPDFELCNSGAGIQLFDRLAEDFIFTKNLSLLKKIPYPELKKIFLFYFKNRLKHGRFSFFNREDFRDWEKIRGFFLSSSFVSSKGFSFLHKDKALHSKQNHLLDFLNTEPKDKLKDLFSDEDSFKAELFIPLFEEMEQAGEKLFPYWIEEKKKSLHLDMEDLLLLSLEFLRQSPKTAGDFAREWDYWLIDEYQDTSWIQEQIIDQITKFKTVFCVGDPGQSIYLFREADPYVFKRREEALSGEVKKLKTNYRSVGSLIYFYNDFFSGKGMFMELEPPLSEEGEPPPRPPLSGELRVDPLSERLTGPPLSKEGEPSLTPPPLFNSLPLSRGLKVNPLSEGSIGPPSSTESVSVISQPNIWFLTYGESEKQHKKPEKNQSQEQEIKQGIEQGIEQGTKQGIEQSTKQGIEQSTKQGIEQGIEQNTKQGTKQGIKQGAKQKEKEETFEESSSMSALEALCFYIQKLLNEGANFSDIAILSSRNNDLAKIADHLRERQFPVLLNSSKNFAGKRLTLDALLLLKFLINPYDSTNLKALLRTPFFRVSDQKLSDISFTHVKLSEQEEKPSSFWAFVKEHYPEQFPFRYLSNFLDKKKEIGIVKSFELALMNSGLMDLSYFQDRTGSAEADLWKLLSLLNKNSSRALELFYSLIGENQDSENEREAVAEDEGGSLQLLTIHACKGLEFKHVIVMDFSIAKSSLKSIEPHPAFYDERSKKAGFSVPLGGREREKIKSFGHKVYNRMKQRENLLEKDRLFYVAMSRAKQSLAFFIPNFIPQKNSWLIGQSFFEDFSSKTSKDPLLSKEHNAKGKLISWKLNDGIYSTNSYSFCVKSSRSIKSYRDFIQQSDENSTEGLRPKTAGNSSLSLSDKRGLASKLQESDIESQKSVSPSVSLLAGQNKAKEGGGRPSAKEIEPADPSVFGKSNKKGREKLFAKGKDQTDLSLSVFSSRDFVKYALERDKNQPLDLSRDASHKVLKQDLPSSAEEESLKQTLDPEAFSMKKPEGSILHPAHTVNSLLKRNLGDHLHIFLKRLCFQPFSHLSLLIDRSFLSEGEKTQIKQALEYVLQLKDPDMGFFLKKGFPERGFQLKTHNILLQGQMDLWGWQKDKQEDKPEEEKSGETDQKNIHLFDYKSSKSQATSAWLQLIFYSWILNQAYTPKRIFMYAVYPFHQEFKKQEFSPSHKHQIEKWLTTLN